MWWVNLLSALLGGLLATGGGVAVHWYGRKLDIRYARQALAAALAGEIEAICAITDRRGYCQHAEQMIAAMQQGMMPPSRFTFRVTHDYVVVFDRNAGSLGLLPGKLAGSVALFYTQVKSILEDVSNPADDPGSVEAAIAVLSEQLQLMNDTLALGRRLVGDLKEVAG